MSLKDDIKKAAMANGTKIQSSESAALEKKLNKMFYLDKNINEEVKFLKQVMTRGQEIQERIGLHASSVIVSDNKFCVRQQVLSLFYKQSQGENINAGLKRIFEEGNAIHEKWQRLFIRAGYARAIDCDNSDFCDDYDLSFTPDIMCALDEFGPLVGEIKSVNTFQFKKIDEHPSGVKQLQLYMRLKQYKRGFVLMEDKNTQEFKIRIYEYDPYIVEPFIDRLEEIQDAKHNLLKNHRMICRHKLCSNSSCTMSLGCPMRNACWGIYGGKVKLDEEVNCLVVHKDSCK